MVDNVGMNNERKPAAARAVSVWLRSEGLSQGALARSLDVTPAAVSKWLTGKQKPPAWARLAIEKLTESAVTVASWLEEDERDRVGASVERLRGER